MSFQSSAYSWPWQGSNLGFPFYLMHLPWALKSLAPAMTTIQWFPSLAFFRRLCATISQHWLMPSKHPKGKVPNWTHELSLSEFALWLTRMFFSVILLWIYLETQDNSFWKQAREVLFGAFFSNGPPPSMLWSSGTKCSFQTSLVFVPGSSFPYSCSLHPFPWLLTSSPPVFLLIAHQSLRSGPHSCHCTLGIDNSSSPAPDSQDNTRTAKQLEAFGILGFVGLSSYASCRP